MPEHYDPARYPLQSLSHNSISTYEKCPMKWRYRYLEGKLERIGGPIVCGAAAGSAINEHFWNVKDGLDPLSAADVEDKFADEWKAKVEIENDKAGIDWGSEKPEAFRSTTQGALVLYHQNVALNEPPPVGIERPFKFRIAGMPWHVSGFIDRELVDPLGGPLVKDMKVSAKKASASVVDEDEQIDMYLLARRAEGKPARGEGESEHRFQFDRMVRTKTPTVQIQPAVRSDAQLDAFVSKLLNTAADIAMRVENDQWVGAPSNAWWCGERYCGYWSECPFGGLARTRATQATRAAGTPAPVAA